MRPFSFSLLVLFLACALVLGDADEFRIEDGVDEEVDVDRRGEETLTSLIDRVEGFLTNLDEAHENVEFSLEKVPIAVTEALADLKQTLEAVTLLKASAAGVQTELDTEKAELAKIQEEVVSSLGGKDQEIEGKQAELKEKEVELEGKQKVLEEKQKELGELRKELEDSKTQLQKTTAEKKTVSDELQKEKLKEVALEKVKNRVQSELDEEKNKNKEEIKKEADLQRSFEKEKSKLDGLKSNVKTVLGDYEKIKEEYERVKQDLNHTTLKEREVEADLHRLEDDFEKLSQKHVEDIAQLNDPKLLDYLSKTAIAHNHPELAVALNKTLQRMAPAGEVLLSGVAVIEQANEVIGDSLSGYMEQQQASTLGVVITYGLFTVPIAVSFRILSRIHMVSRYHFGLLLNFYCAAFFFILFIMSFVAVNEDALQALRIWNDPLFDFLQLLFFFVFISQMTVNVFSLSAIYSGRVPLVAQVGVYFQMMLSVWFGFQYYDTVWKRAMLEMQPVMGRWMYLLGCTIFSSGIFVSIKFMIPKKSHTTSSIFGPNNAEKEV